MTNVNDELGVHRSSFCGVPINVTYRYIDAEECGWDVELLAAHLRGYPDIDVKEGLSDEWIDICEADAGYHHHDERRKGGSSSEDHEPFESLVGILGLSYLYAKDKESVTMIHLFGIRYAEDIRHCGRSVTELVKHTSIPNSYVTEVQKGMRLAKFVKPV